MQENKMDSMKDCLMILYSAWRCFEAFRQLITEALIASLLRWDSEDQSQACNLYIPSRKLGGMIHFPKYLD